MYRSVSTTRVSDDHIHMRALSTESSELLPVYDPMSEVAKKEKARAKVAENAVHLIPVVLILCAFVLWFFSTPNIDAKGNDTIGANVEGMTIDGDLDSDSAGHLPVDLGDLDPAKLGDAKSLFSENRS